MPAVEVRAPGAADSALTGDDGRFALTLPLGTHELVFRKIGFRVARVQVELFEIRETSLEVILTADPQRLPDVVAEAEAPADPTGFSERRQAIGGATFLDEALLRRSEHRKLSDLIRARSPGIRMVRRNGRTLAMSRRSSSECPMAIWLDGTRLYAPTAVVTSPFLRKSPEQAGANQIPDLDHWGVIELKAVEVYSVAQTPSRFQSTGSGCGTILLWTRDR